MKTLKVNFVIFMVLFFGACTPDLIIDNIECSWDSATDGTKTIDVTIKNIGNKESGTFLVYINPDENPESSNYRPQFRKEIETLVPNGDFQITLNTSDFEEKMHVDNDSLRRVYQISVLIDPKGMVKESNEDNNEAVCNF